MFRLKSLNFFDKYWFWNIDYCSSTSFTTISLSQKLIIEVIIVCLRQARQWVFWNHNFYFFIICIHANWTFFQIIVFQNSFYILIVVLKPRCWLCNLIGCESFLINYNLSSSIQNIWESTFTWLRLLCLKLINFLVFNSYS